MGKAIDHAGRDPQQAGHDRHSSCIIRAVAMTCLQQPGDGIDIVGDRGVIQSIGKLRLIAEMRLEHLKSIIHTCRALRPLLGCMQDLQVKQLQRGQV